MSSRSLGVDLNEAVIKKRAGEFDIESVYTLNFVGMQLRSITAVAVCTNLTELDVSDNHIRSLDGVGGLESLKKLVVDINRVERLEPLKSVKSLEALHIEANNISNVDEVKHLAELPNLHTLHFRRVYADMAAPNPVCGHPSYRAVVLRLLPALTNLDGERLAGDEAAQLVYAETPQLAPDAPPLEVPVVEPVFTEAMLRSVREAVSGGPLIPPETEKAFEDLVLENRRLAAKAESLVSNYIGDNE